jgi:hypothetical protein
MERTNYCQIRFGHRNTYQSADVVGPVQPFVPDKPDREFDVELEMTSGGHFTAESIAILESWIINSKKIAKKEDER